MFFGLSGFLVTGSALRTQNGFKFFVHRVLRIVPALSVEVLLSAFVLGTLLTTKPLNDYFHDSAFWSYFGNIIGIVQMSLPGMFEKNAFPDVVNGNLWTLTPEYYCYLILLLAMTIGLFQREKFYITILCFSAFFFVAWDYQADIGKPHFFYTSAGLVFSFCAGSLFFALRSKIQHRIGWAAASAVLYLVLFRYTQHFSLLATLCLVYLTVYLGCVRLPVPPPFSKGDYSYGIYLYGFPIQQTLSENWTLMRHWYLMFPVSLLLTLGFAMVSWHLIEKPLLKLKRYIK